LYKEDFNKFIKALGEAIDYVKTDLMPDFDFDAFNHEYAEGEEPIYEPATVSETITNPSVEPITEPAVPEIEIPTSPEISQPPLDNGATEEVDKW